MDGADELNPQHGPVIGIYSQELFDTLLKDTSMEYKWTRSYIPASYVNFVRMSGARVVPVSAFREREYYDELLPQLNGVFFTGKHVSIQVVRGFRI